MQRYNHSAWYASGLTLCKVLVIHPDVLGRQVGCDLVIVVRLGLHFQITLTGHAARLVAGVHHMPPALDLWWVCVLHSGY